MGPEVRRAARPIHLGLEEGDEVDDAVIVAGVGQAVRSVVVEASPIHRPVVGALQRFDEQFAEAQPAVRTGVENPHAVASILVVRVGTIGDHPVEHLAIDRDVAARHLGVVRANAVGKRGGSGREEHLLVVLRRNGGATFWKAIGTTGT